MAIGAVVFSFPVALLGSIFMSFLNGLVLWQGFAAYSALGFLTLLLIFTMTGMEAAARGTDASNAQVNGPRT